MLLDRFLNGLSGIYILLRHDRLTGVSGLNILRSLRILTGNDILIGCRIRLAGILTLRYVSGLDILSVYDIRLAGNRLNSLIGLLGVGLGWIDILLRRSGLFNRLLNR